MILDFSKMEFKNLDDTPLLFPDIHKSIGEICWAQRISMPAYRASFDIYDGKQTEVDNETIDAIIQLIQASQRFTFAVEIPLIEFLNNLKNTQNENTTLSDNERS